MRLHLFSALALLSLLLAAGCGSDPPPGRDDRQHHDQHDHAD